MPSPLRLLVLDTETTGFVPKIHRVMEFACAVIEEGKVVKEYEQLLELPEGCEIPQAVQVLTRIYPQDLAGKPTFEKILPLIEAMLTPETVIVGQNVKFDLGMLKGEGWDLSERPNIDTAMLASLVFPELASYSLGFVSKALSLNHNPPHRALGDVRATVQLLQKCSERLAELPAADVDRIKELAARGPDGYRRFFDGVFSKAKKRPTWLAARVGVGVGSLTQKSVEEGEMGAVALQEEPLDPSFVPSILAGLKGKTWCAVKNIEATVDRHALTGVTILYPPEFLIADASKKKFLAQEQFTADELTLAIKLELYEPAVRSDLPIHGEEYTVFTGKLAADAKSTTYAALRKKAESGPCVLSHQHLLTLCADSEKPLPSGLGMIIDDASMLEDTATNAYAWTCHLPSLRGAAQGNPLLTKTADLIELWAERVRNGIDLRYLAPSDFDARDATELRSTLEKVLESELPPQARTPIAHLLNILNHDNLAGRFAWIEAMQDGSKTIKSVPEDIGELLAATLYAGRRTTLLVPPRSEQSLSTILPDRVPKSVMASKLPAPGFNLSMPVGSSLEGVFRSPVGKQILLVSSKRTIEDVFVRHTETLEEDGVALICQGFCGGLSRMQAEFAIAKAPAILVMTPWMFEGINLPLESVDRLTLQVLPFDHPSHPVVSRRAQRFRDPFNDYSLPRLRHRLFRLMRTYSRHAKTGSTFEILDDRLRTKEYGKQTAKYLESLVPGGSKPKQEGQLPLL